MAGVAARHDHDQYLAMGIDRDKVGGDAGLLAIAHIAVGGKGAGVAIANVVQFDLAPSDNGVDQDVRYEDRQDQQGRHCHARDANPLAAGRPSEGGKVIEFSLYDCHGGSPYSGGNSLPSNSSIYVLTWSIGLSG